MARTENNLWVATGITLKNTFFGFVTGVSSGFAAGLIFDLARRAVTNYASTHLREQAKNYLATILNRQDPV